MNVLVVRTGVANLASVLAALGRAGATVTFSTDADEVTRADRVVLPGVGAFGAGRAALAETGVDAALAARVEAGRPTLGICLGMQLFFASSEETPGVAGLGVIAAPVRRFDAPGIRVPQLGWNQVRPGEGCRFVQPGHALFANSYRAVEAPAWAVATADHGGPFVAAAERGDALLCQFHPELSGAWGAALLSRWLAA